MNYTAYETSSNNITYGHHNMNYLVSYNYTTLWVLIFAMPNTDTNLFIDINITVMSHEYHSI